MSRRDHARVGFCVGPSVSAHEFQAACASINADVTIFPPIQQGDLLQLIDDLPDVIGIVDGYFLQVPSVLHKEILFAMERGARVLGASSIGALRAAELDGFGMEGVGEIYRWYRRGVIDGDDEVAVLHGSEVDGFRPLSEPLVNMRYNVRRARARRIVSARTAATLVTVAKGLHFARRTYDEVFRQARLGGAPMDEIDALHRFLRHEAVNLKQEDALALVKTVASRVNGWRPWPAHVPVRTNQTIFFHLSRRAYEGTMLAGQHVPDRLVLTLHKLLSPSWPRLFRRVALRCVAIDQALHLGMRAADENSLLARFRLSSGLAADEALEAWRFERSLSQEELVESLRQRDLEAQILGRYHMGENGQRGIGAQYALVVADVVRRTGLDERRLTRPPLMQPGIPWESPFVRELKLRNRFALARARAGEIVRGVAEASRWGLPQALSPERLTAWTAIRWGVDPGTLDEELADRGFASYRELLDAARLAYLHERLSIGPNVEASR